MAVIIDKSIDMGILGTLSGNKKAEKQKLVLIVKRLPSLG